MTKAEEIYEKHIGSNADLGYIPAIKQDILDAINEALSQHDVILSLPNKCTCWGGNIDCFSGNCTVCGNRKGNGI